MTVSLDNVFVATCLQALESLGSLVGKAEAHCASQGLEAETVTKASLAPDMWPFAKQVGQACHHSSGAIAGVRAGVFNPDPSPAPSDFASLSAQVADAIAVMRAVSPGELDAIATRDMRFEFRDWRMDFTVENFLLSFSLPNFFFHVTTAYAILRSLGLDVGKRDFLGAVRVKPEA